MGINTNIGEQKRAADLLEHTVRERTEQLEGLNEDLQNLAHVVSHEMQEPIVTITSYLKLLAVRYQDRLGTDADEFIAKSVKASRRLERMINDLWSYARVSKPYIEQEPVSLNVCVRDALSELRERIEQKKAQITVDDLPTVRGNKSLLTQLFENLLENSLRYCQRTPMIKVSVCEESDEWCVSFSDNGTGIDPIHSNEIFRLYTRLSTKDEATTGLGLAICKKIAAVHRARIWLESSTPEGSVFCVAFPRKDA